MASCTACTRLPGLVVATPSAIAAWATATAVVAEEARRLSTGGYQRRAGRADVDLAGYRLGRRQGALPAVTLDAPDTIVPRPSPGYSSALFA